MPKKLTATEVSMEMHNKMMAEYRESLLTDDKLFRGAVLARLETIEQQLSQVIANTFRRPGLFG